jgi:hypothetical protein
MLESIQMMRTTDSDNSAIDADRSEARVFVYCIDHADHIISVDEAWLKFASDNGAPELTREEVDNKELWRFISDPDTRLIYRLLFDAVRTRMQSVSISYRCDSPTVRRYMELTCSPRPKLGIEIQSRIIREEPREYVSMLDVNQSRSRSVITICAWCKQCRVSEFDWREIEDAVPDLGAFSDSMLPQVSHGMCPTCHLDKLKEMRSNLRACG